jgi:hypothetical protein
MFLVHVILQILFICRLHLTNRALGQSSNYDYQTTNQNEDSRAAAPQTCEDRQPAKVSEAKIARRGEKGHGTTDSLSPSLLPSDQCLDPCGALGAFGIPSSGASAEA